MRAGECSATEIFSELSAHLFRDFISCLVFSFFFPSIFRIFFFKLNIVD